MTKSNQLKKQIRRSFGHGRGYRTVKITTDGQITYWGSTDPFDRTHDYWHDGGTVDDFRRSSQCG